MDLRDRAIVEPMVEFEVRSINIPGYAYPEPENRDKEIEAVNSAVDASLIGYSPTAYWESNSSSVTAWVAFQLGCIAEHYASMNDLESSMALAIYAVEAANISNDQQRIRSNFVTLANVLFRSRRFEEALSVYEKIVVSDRSNLSPEVVAALMGMANCLLSLGRPSEAAVSFEKGYLSLRGKLDLPTQRQIASAFASICAGADDIGGVFFAMCDYDEQRVRKFLLETSIPEMSFDVPVSTHTRLKSLQMIQDAEALRTKWLEHNTKEKKN
jgi:pentatricopeptide repeat protein